MEWTRYWRATDQPLEAMHAHLTQHVYDRHSHESYSFGVTDAGAQAFTCRGAAHTSAAGMVMAFNPDEPHDGRAAADGGFTYRIVHIGPDLVSDVLSDVAGRSIGLPLFVAPVLPDAELAQALRQLYAALVGGTRLRRDETLSTVVAALVCRGSQARGIPGRPVRRDDRAAARVRALLADSYVDDLSAADLARVAGLSRFETSRRFRAAYGVPPSEYQRLLRLRMARRLLAAGSSAADAASAAGFADQSHLTRWFRRVYGITPAAYQRAGRQTDAA